MKHGSHLPPTYLRFSRRLQLTMFGGLLSGSPAHLRWIAGVLKLARNANRIGAIFNSFVSNMYRILLLECQFSPECLFSPSVKSAMCVFRSLKNPFFLVHMQIGRLVLLKCFLFLHCIFLVRKCIFRKRWVCIR